MGGPFLDLTGRQVLTDPRAALWCDPYGKQDEGVDTGLMRGGQGVGMNATSHVTLGTLDKTRL